MHRKTVFSSWHFLSRSTAALIMAVCLFGDRTGAQQQVGTPRETNFDIRSAPTTAAAAYLNRMALQPSVRAALDSAMATGLERLRAEFSGVDVLESPLTGTVEVVGVKPGSGFLSGPSTDRAGAMRGFIAGHAEAYGLAQDQVQSLDLVADYSNPSGNMSWVEFEQRLNGVPVFQGLVRGGFTRDGELARITGPLAAGLDPAALGRSAAMDAAKAVSLAAAHVGWNVPETSLVLKAVGADGQRVTFERASMADDAKAWPVYFPLAPGVARLAWATEIWGDPDVYLVVVDAEDGTVLFRKNQTNYQTQSATYNIYNDDSPAPMSPSTVLPGSGTQAPFISRSTITLIGNEAPNTFNNLGWMTDGLNETDGNNVRAGLDLMAPDGIESTVAGSNRTFNFTYNPQTDATSAPSYRNGEVTDMFYWTNLYHDRLYQLGFTEAAGNFQNDNFGRGGLGGDKIRAEGQDYSGTNNANFSTPSDGTSGRMQMYIFPGSTPGRTSGIDHDVVLHELTHGTSNRLHNNATGLASQVSAGMGEGWSDFYARALLSSVGEDVNGVYPSGAWVTYQISAGFVDNYYYGIRRFPYAVKTRVGANGKPHNPLTLADIDPLQINLGDGAFAPAFVGTAFEVHNIGEVWCMALLEVRARFITRLGYAAGNQRILQFVTDGMKMDPLNPTPLTGRDAILAAAAAGGGTAADIADIWAGFAARGMGVQATFNVSTFFAGESYNVPGGLLPSFSIDDVSTVEGNSGTSNATFTVTLANAGSLASDARVTWATTDGTASTPGTTVTSPAVINIPALGTAAPYPSNLVVAGVPSPITHLRVRLNGVAHTFPGDMDALLVGPGGQKVVLTSGAWNGLVTAPTPADLTFEDGAQRPPFGVAPTGPVTGTYQPTNYFNSTLPGAPAGPYSTVLSVFNGTNPNGTWSLYVYDHANPDSGTINGYSLIFSTASTDDYIPSSGTLTFPVGGSATQTISVPIVGDLNIEANETFVVNLSFASGAAIGDPQGVGTILNDEAGFPPPIPITSPATSITSTTAVLNGTVNPNGVATTARFEYGLTTAYGNLTPLQAAGSGSSVVAIGGGAITGLLCNSVYHFRATATSAGGTANGLDATFTTGTCLPAVTTGFPTAFSATGATLNGIVNPNGNATTAWFEYGTTTSYGSVTPVQAGGAGGSPIAIGGGAVTGLSCDIPYHFRARATNAFGTSIGSDQIFSPPCAGTINPRLYVVANDSNSIQVKNAATLATVASIALPATGTSFDVAVMPDQSLAFAARTDGIWVVDLKQSPPVLASGLNPIPTPTGMPFVEDMSLTRDGRFLVASDGGAASPIAVIDTKTRAVASSLSVFTDHDSVEVCDNAAVLVTSFFSNSVRRLAIGPTGTLTDTGQSLATPGPNNVACAPGGRTGVVVNVSTGDIRSFLVNGMTPVATQVLPGNGVGVNVAFGPNGTRVFARRASDVLTSYAFDPGTGVIGARLWSTNVGPLTSFFGVDQIAVDPTGQRVYASTAGYVLSLDAATGALNGSAVAINPSGIALRAAAPVRADFDGDGKTDIGIFRPSTGVWWIEQSSTGYSTSFQIPWGLSTDIRVPGDYDGDHKADLAVFRPSTGTWFVLQSSTGYTTYTATQWGLSTDVPVAGDYDGDGKADLAVYRPSTGTWFILQSSTGYTTYTATQWGLSSDVPVSADYDGDGRADLAVFRPSTGTWFVLQSSTGYTTYTATQWGLSTDVPVAGDYDGDGKADLAVYRPSTGTWWILQSGSCCSPYLQIEWGLSTDIPVPGDYDGDGKLDIAVYRPSTDGVWFALLSSTNYTTYRAWQWGLGTDLPAAGK